MTPDLEQIRELFLKLKAGHDYLGRHRGQNLECIKLIERAESIFQQLENLGVNRGFSTALLIYGKEFLLHEQVIKILGPTLPKGESSHLSEKGVAA